MPDRPFWKESDSTASSEEAVVRDADDIRARQRVIGVELRQWFDDVANEPVPDAWLELLKQGDSGGKVQTNGQAGIT